MRFSRQADIAHTPATFMPIPLLGRFASNTAGYTLVLSVIVLIVLLGTGLGADSLPFPPQSAYSDAAVSHWPAALYLQQSIRAGHLPLWRDLLMSGQPFAANPLNKVWYPPQWLVVLFPVTLFLNLMVWAHLVLAADSAIIRGCWRGPPGCCLRSGVVSVDVVGSALRDLTNRTYRAADRGTEPDLRDVFPGRRALECLCLCDGGGFRFVAAVAVTTITPDPKAFDGNSLACFGGSYRRADGG